jgi:hypothetical protein
VSKEPQHHHQESAPEIGGQNGGNKGAKKQLARSTGAVEKKIALRAMDGQQCPSPPEPSSP